MHEFLSTKRKLLGRDVNLAYIVKINIKLYTITLQ